MQGGYIKMQKDSINKENSQSEDGTEPCEKCDGVGWVSMIPDDPNCEYAKPCPLCEGEGVVDWVRKIMGYTKPKREFDMSMTGQWQIKPAGTNFKYLLKTKE